MINGIMVDEIVWDEDVASVANDMIYTNAPITIIIKNTNTFFMVQISPFFWTQHAGSIRHILSHQYLFSYNNKVWRGTGAMQNSGWSLVCEAPDQDYKNTGVIMQCNTLAVLQGMRNDAAGKIILENIV